MEYIKYCIPVNVCYTTLTHNDKLIANGGFPSTCMGKYCMAQMFDGAKF